MVGNIWEICRLHSSEDGSQSTWMPHLSHGAVHVSRKVLRSDRGSDFRLRLATPPHDVYFDTIWSGQQSLLEMVSVTES